MEDILEAPQNAVPAVPHKLESEGPCYFSLAPAHTSAVSLTLASYRPQQKLLRARDERARLTRELLGGIKAIKLNAWEAPFGGRVEAAREAELELMGKLVELRSLLSALFSCTPTLVAVVMLGSSTALYKMPLTLKTAMTVSPCLWFPSLFLVARSPDGMSSGGCGTSRVVACLIIVRGCAHLTGTGHSESSALAVGVLAVSAAISARGVVISGPNGALPQAS